MVEVGPTDEVEVGRGPYLVTDGINVRSEIIRLEVSFLAELCPHFLQVSKDRLVREDTAHELSPVTGVAHLIGPIHAFVGRIGCLVVLEGKVGIPDGAGIEMVVATFLEVEYLTKHIGITIELAYQEMSAERFDVKD